MAEEAAAVVRQVTLETMGAREVAALGWLPEVHQPPPLAMGMPEGLQTHRSPIQAAVVVERAMQVAMQP